MKALIYTRVTPDNSKVARTDRLEAQRKRCRDFLLENGITPFGACSDQGVMHPQHLLPGMKRLLQHLAQEGERMIVVSDHRGRLGLDTYIQNAVIAQIADLGGYFIAVYGASELRQEILNMARKQI